MSSSTQRDSPNPVPAAENRPLLLLDVDGTMTATRQRSFPFDYSADYQTFATSIRSRDIRILFRPDVVHAIDAASSSLEVKWHTMWGAHSATHFASLLELEAFGVTDLAPVGTGTPDEGPGALRWWKFTAILAEAKAAHGRPVMWLDDGIGLDLQKQMIASPLTPPSLSWIQPRSTRGLDAEDLKSLASWIGDPSVPRQIFRAWWRSAFEYAVLSTQRATADATNRQEVTKGFGVLMPLLCGNLQVGCFEGLQISAVSLHRPQHG